jgi:hypothetical protein
MVWEEVMYIAKGWLIVAVVAAVGFWWHDSGERENEIRKLSKTLHQEMCAGNAEFKKFWGEKKCEEVLEGYELDWFLLQYEDY